MALEAVAGIERHVGKWVKLTTTSPPLPGTLRTSKPHTVEGELVAVADGTVVLKVLGWSAWCVPVEDITRVQEGER